MPNRIHIGANRLVVLVGALVVAGSAAATPASSDPRSIAATSAASTEAAREVAEFSARKRSAKSKSKSSAKSKSASKAKSKAKSKSTKSDVKSAAVPLPNARPDTAALAPSAAAAAAVASAVEPKSAAGQALAIPPAATTSIRTAAIDVAALKRAIEFIRGRKQSQANDVKKAIADPVAQKVVEWAILRSDDAGSSFARYVAFISANPDWFSIVTLRRKAEAMALTERPEPGAVRAYFDKWPPLSARGKFALARALAQSGDRKAAEALVRDAWRHDAFSEDIEKRAHDAFGEFLTRDDHKARMNRRLYESGDTDAGMRMAKRLGGHEPLIAKARAAMHNRSANKAAVEAVPAAARDDVGYKYARAQMLRRLEKFSDAAAVMRTVPNPMDSSHDADEWWVERRVLARDLVEHGDPKAAYQVVVGATEPWRDNYKVEHQFMAGWIALRFLKDPATAYGHFSKIPKLSDNPISLARGHYWLGRAAEALNRNQEARRYYQEAARHPTAYYGQIARAKAGLGELTLNPFPALSAAQRAQLAQVEVVRAVELLFAVDARDLAQAALADLGDKHTDIGVLALLAEITAKYRDARGMLLVGKFALARGYPLDHAAFPTIGVPDYKPIGPEVEPAIVYSIVRQESWFNPRTVSSAKAMGLMQVTPPAGRYIAKKFGVAFDQNKLLKDMVYNVQFGAAEIGDVIKDYRGSYIMAFAAYNAGRGRVRDWVARFGDPRDPKVDPIDWVEKIPFSETRNYVQRVFENVQVYRVRFGGSARLLVEADLRRGASAN